jgi:hypothetical protein
MDSRLIFRRQRLGIFYFLPPPENSRVDWILVFGFKVSVLQGFTRKSNHISFDLS